MTGFPDCATMWLSIGETFDMTTSFNVYRWDNAARRAEKVWMGDAKSAPHAVAAYVKAVPTARLGDLFARVAAKDEFAK